MKLPEGRKSSSRQWPHNAEVPETLHENLYLLFSLRSLHFMAKQKCKGFFTLHCLYPRFKWAMAHVYKEEVN